jgi:hypothetical protein
MKKRFLSILSIALVLLTLKGIKADDTTLLDFDISGAVADPYDDTTYYVKIPTDSSTTTVTLTATGDDLDSGDSTLTCTACDGSIDDPEEVGKPQWDIDYDVGEQSDNGNGELITWDVNSSVSRGGYDFSVNSVSQNFKCPSDDTSHGDNTAEDDNGSQTYSIVAVATVSITINTFIADNNIPGPPPSGNLTAGLNTVYQGDNRSQGSENGSHRTQYKLQVVPNKQLKPDGLDGNPTSDVGQTVAYDKSSSLVGGNLTDEAKNDSKLYDDYLKIDQGTASADGLISTSKYLATGKLQIECKCTAANPIAIIAPAIKYDFTITIDNSDPKNPKYTVEGQCKRFPDYEIYINGKQVWGLPGSNFLALAGPMLPIQGATGKLP